VEVRYHRLFQRDVNSAVRHDDDEGGQRLGDGFFRDLEGLVKQVLSSPKGFHFIDDGYRRAQLGRFPYHVIYQESKSRIKFLVLRHDKRHPMFGLKRR
jgi:hypothetical protein